MDNRAPQASRAARFFWVWLIGSATFSTLGVVTHAVLGSARSPVIASVLAFVIVMIQLCATYGVHALVQARIVGATYRWALAITVTLALGAFVLNFVALRDLVITWAGIAPAIAWIVPLIVDLGITASTIAILALTDAQRAEQLHAVVHHEAQSAASVHVEVHNTVHAEAVAVPGGAHLSAAQRIIAQGGVRIEPERIAAVLDVAAEGIDSASIIGRRTNVHHKTVQRILDARQVAHDGA